MSDEGKSDRGRVVYSRPEAAGGVGSGLAGALGAGGALWQALLPLLVGFALLLSLVVGLGVVSDREIEKISFETEQEERRLNLTSNHLLNLRMALNNLHAEARIRGRIEAGTQGVMLPPIDLRLRNARAEVERLLPDFDRLQFKDPVQKQKVRDGIVAYVEITKDLDSYSLEGFSQFRELDEAVRSLSSEASTRRSELEEKRRQALEDARGEIRFLMLMAALTGGVVAGATTLEVSRRFRQMRRANAALRRERQFSAQMLGGMPSAVAAIDREDRIRSANASFLETFPGARVGASIHDELATGEAQRMLAAATATRVRRTTYRGRWALAAAGDARQPRAYDVYSSPLEVGGEPGQLLTLVDVTEAALAEKELRRQESLAAVGKAAAQVAHEIKNPLGSIRLGVALLRDMTRETDAQKTLDLVERGINHLNKITVDVTQFSRSSELALAEADLHTLLDESLDLVVDKIREKRTPVERRYAADLPEGLWDEDQLRQVFVNLVGNAVDASPPEAPVEGVRVRVSDRGAGMDEQTRARLFEPFFTTKKRGTGLGLAVAKRIVEQHGGAIRVESAPGHGTCFTVELPLSAEGG